VGVTQLAFMTELVELQHWRCPWCGDCLPGSPSGTAIDHIIPRVYGSPHRRWNFQLLHQECNSARRPVNTVGIEAGDLSELRLQHHRPGAIADRVLSSTGCPCPIRGGSVQPALTNDRRTLVVARMIERRLTLIDLSLDKRIYTEFVLAQIICRQHMPPQRWSFARPCR